MQTSKPDVTGMAVEVVGKIVGKVISADEKTLLIRKGSVYSLDGETDSFVARPNAVFVDRKLVEDAYWIRVLPTSLGTESGNINRSIDAVREFLDM